MPFTIETDHKQRDAAMSNLREAAENKDSGPAIDAVVELSVALLGIVHSQHFDGPEFSKLYFDAQIKKARILVYKYLGAKITNLQPTKEA